MRILRIWEWRRQRRARRRARWHARRRWASRRMLSSFFIGAGTMHFVAPEAYIRIMPPYVPLHKEVVLATGAAEMAGGTGVLIPPLRRASGWSLIALLIGVFPANLHMALHPETTDYRIPRILLWLRLPLQPLMILWVWRATLAN